ncbi:hypothetical protein HaLaN_19061 [Haematococcus lacustris]|uniref:Uncharacterized protein n=1 Tax=Haematococcus lacustris TaxID=44745 RepID=A0A699ZGK5_HAELA|nr:hypothetical protein HaLaN_19061 [Haematococcus lacustris]
MAPGWTQKAWGLQLAGLTGLLPTGLLATHYVADLAGAQARSTASAPQPTRVPMPAEPKKTTSCSTQSQRLIDTSAISSSSCRRAYKAHMVADMVASGAGGGAGLVLATAVCCGEHCSDHWPHTALGQLPLSQLVCYQLA